MSDAVLYTHQSYILQLHIHNTKAEESSAGKKIYIKTTKYEKCPKLPMGSKVTPVDGTHYRVMHFKSLKRNLQLYPF